VRNVLFTLEEVVNITGRYNEPVYTIQTVKGHVQLDFEGNVLECNIDDITILDNDGDQRKQLTFEETKNRLKNAVLNILQKIRE